MYTVLEEKGIRAYLEKRGLLKRYKEKKELFKKGKIQQITLKKRQPKSIREYQFRITKKYRAYGYFFNPDVFIVTEISDHQ